MSQRLLLSSQLSPSSLSFYFWMKQTFYICDLEERKKKNLSPPHITDEAQRGCESLLGKTCPWTGCVNDWTGKARKKIMQHLLSVFWLTCSFVEHEWHLRFISACMCARRIRSRQMLEMFLISSRSSLSFRAAERRHRVCLFICDGRLSICVFVLGLRVTWKI